MVQLTGGVESVQVLIGPHLVHDRGYAREFESKGFIVVEELVVHVVLQSVWFIDCRPVYRSTKTSKSFHIHIED